ncbi:hypothetical protein F383_10299 [Gossypium arboreum]|uniref:Uncharacterized protein n=1 Tax=Gossypium arboreum TaxID=29729 RepID=A0A0B0PAS0_GOSAR|nr:hypothetical protein F383_10299 [Gossypium arboreum]
MAHRPISIIHATLMNICKPI